MTEDASADSFARARAVQSGDWPAETVVELVDALRQNVGSAGTEVSNVRLLVDMLLPDGDPRLDEVLERLMKHLTSAEKKMALALAAEMEKKQ